MRLPLFAVAIAGLALTACATGGAARTGSLPTFTARNPVQRDLAELPPPKQPIAVAVYDFADQTGQLKPSDTVQTFSHAVSQGAASMLVKSLQDAGQHRWFTVVEREQLKNLLQERQIITDMRARYLGEKTVNAQELPALLFAGVLLEGGVIGYDTDTLTGGAGAGFLGISAQTQYRQDTVTVYLRAVSVRSGEVLTTVTASKTIASYQVGVNAFRYVDFKQLLEAEAGFTTNEPGMLALQEAIDKAVYGLVLEGVDLKLWDFADTAAGWPYLWRYQQERDGVYTAEQMEQGKVLANGKALKRVSAQKSASGAEGAARPSLTGPG
jgi:curli production assembly/transport component CsgG